MNLTLSHWKSLGSPYYQIDFKLPTKTIEITAGDAVQIQGETASLPIMQTNPTQQNISCIFKDSENRTSDHIQSFFSDAAHYQLIQAKPPHKTLPIDRPTLLLGQNEHIASLILHAKQAGQYAKHIFAIAECQDKIFFKPKPSSFIVNGIDSSAIACIPLLEDWGIVSRVTCKHPHPGCFEGSAITLASQWINANIDPQTRLNICVYGHDDFIASASQLNA